MRALRITGPGRPLEAADLPRPSPGPGEVLIDVVAAGICHSDAHYRAGRPLPRLVPVTPGHEIAGVVSDVGEGVDAGLIGARVAVHYVVACRACSRCLDEAEQFCTAYGMVGNTRDGGYADAVVVPAANAVPVPDGVDLGHAAVMMCSTATSYHALRRGRLKAGETVAVFGVGGLGMSAVQLARILGAERVLAVDRDPGRLEIAEALGATPIVANGAGIIDEVDVALDLVGAPAVTEAGLRALAPRGRLVLVGITQETLTVSPYQAIVGPEREILGCNDHTLAEVGDLMAWAEAGTLDLAPVITGEVPLDVGAVNAALDRLDSHGPGIRTLIRPA
ncbi:MAG: alcohol dehydrogenase catalytic domain-containing protein [Acidimicrobiia bacterium]|nr:alcohol dehydrogenase catalytic domain-containing protein [Acidimicrobiia bacterium]